MDKLSEKMKLVEEAVELIKEFKELLSVFGENSLNSIVIKDNGDLIEVDDEYCGVSEYSLDYISSIFTIEMRGFGPCSAKFYEALDFTESELSNYFRKQEKDEFIKFAGSLKYAEFRCENIYNRLIEIEELYKSKNKMYK